MKLRVIIREDKEDGGYNISCPSFVWMSLSGRYHRRSAGEH